MDITSLIEAARISRERRISLVASENALSPRALRALSSDLHNRYLRERVAELAMSRSSLVFCDDSGGP